MVIFPLYKGKISNNIVRVTEKGLYNIDGRIVIGGCKRITELVDEEHGGLENE